MFVIICLLIFLYTVLYTTRSVEQKMTSIFNLKTSTEELSSLNEGTSLLQHDQIAPSRSVAGSAFPSGVINFKFQTSGQKWWKANSSYLRTRIVLGKPGTDDNGSSPLDYSDDIAPNMNILAGMFQSMTFKMNGKKLSVIEDFVAQVDTLKKRTTLSKSTIDSIGNATSFWDPQFKTRQQQVIVDGNNQIIAPIVTPKLTPAGSVPSSSNGLGYDALATVAVSAVGVLTFAANGGAALPLNAVTWAVGDLIEIARGGVVGTVQYRVSAILSATTLQLNNQPYVVMAATTLPFSRIREVAIKDNTSRRATAVEIIWTPPLSVFELAEGLPAGDFELSMMPQSASTYKRTAIQSVGSDKTPNTSLTATPTVGSDYQFSVVDMFLYTKMIDGPRYDNGTFLLDLDQISCQAEKVSGTNFAAVGFDVSPSSYALTVAYQDLRTGTDTRVSVSQFRAWNAGFTATEELKVSRFHINYAGQTKPNPDADPAYSASKDYTVQRYVDTQIDTGAITDTGGCETLDEWRERGAYYYYAWPRDGTDRSTRVTVKSSFDTGSDVANMRVLLFTHSKSVARVTVVDGRVESVDVEDR